MAAANSTKLKILETAEHLFAEQGFAETSLRLITDEAGVNLASVNYHFGSKKELIRAVLARHLDIVMPTLEQNLLDLQHDANIKQVLNALAMAILALNNQSAEGTRIFLQILGRGYMESQGHLRWFIMTEYGQALNVFIERVSNAMPQISRSDLFWRMHFSLGAMIFTIGSGKALIEIAEADFSQNNKIENIVDMLVSYVAAGVSGTSIS
ncbi:TetR/AcrR family transcriptional regulator [Paraferrimonas sp. SM1919]|uniref:TetR/AcrR family transcriptional regulator n=1 Tax=Paraferrimonas sp. SM1919 TaxID=2662263 RepID=UPI0013D084FE|nr:TetR/AcrR family transcriptional regulator [Paraferrimonas sp. SM1919]